MDNTVTYLFDYIDRYGNASPDKVALRDEKHTYTYSELDRLSSHFALRLAEITQGISGKHIGLLYDRSAQSIILMLAIMKAGAVYIPVDEGLPKIRLENILETADISTILSPKKTTFTLPGASIITMPSIELEEISEDFVRAAQDFIIAYGIFTSGSTGLPKLALLSHHAVLSVMEPLTKRYYIDSDDKVMQFANLSFDGSISEIFGAFIAGAELLIPNLETTQSINKLSDYIREKGVTIAVLPPSLLAYLEIDASGLKTVVAAGEPCPPGLAQRMTRSIPYFINAYGPTECAICVSTYEVPKDFSGSTTPIGTPLPGVEIKIVPDNDADTTPDDTGELYVGGPTLFEGYYNDDARTQATLFQSPSTSFYKTGDLVSMEGELLVYHARLGDYIKSRGLRIATTEIENAIRSYSSEIINVAVVAKAQAGDGDIFAYFVSKSEISPKDLRIYLEPLLPKYALPHYFVQMKHLPVNSSGKIDRLKLAEKASTSFATGAEEIGTIADVWGNILHTNINDATDFFLSGGDSLKAMRMLYEVEKRYSLSITLTQLYHHSTLQEFLRLIEELPIVTSAKTPESVLKAASKANAYESMLWTASAHSDNKSTYTVTELLKPDFTIEIDTLRGAISAMDTAFPAASFRYEMNEDGLFKHVSAGITLTVHENIHTSQVAIDAWVDHVANSPIDPTVGPLIQLHYAKTNDNQNFIVLHGHHLVLSASILPIFIRTFWSLYTDPSTTIATDPFMLPDWSDADTAFWKTEYKPDLEYVQLPWSDSKQRRTTRIGRTLTTHLDSRTIGAVTASHYSSFTFYKSIYTLLLHRLSGQENITIGSSVDLRMTDSLGYIPALLNTLPFSSAYTGDVSFGDYINDNQQQTQNILEHRHLPLSHILKLHSFEQDRLIGPFNIMFDYINKTDNYGIGDEGTVESIQKFNATSKYDLTLTVVESPTSLSLQWEYDTNLLSAEAIEQLAAMYERLCTYSLEHPTERLADIPLLNESEEEAMLMIGKGQRIDYIDRTFYEMFSKQVQTTPDKVAVRQADKSVTYKELNFLVEHYSETLLDSELQPEAPVGVFMDRSVEMVASIVALWRLGYAYVPIETSFPKQRIENIIDATKMSAIITKIAYKKYLPAADQLTVIDEEYVVKNPGRSYDEIRIVPNTLSYVIFTSGSTGKPKGVMIEHGGMMNHANGMIHQLGLTADSTIAQTASHSFDISVWQLTTILLVGGTVAIYSKDDQANLIDFTERIRSENVTLLELVPSYLNVFIEHLVATKTQHLLDGVKILLSTGENISWPIVSSWLKHFPNTQLMNAYGPAEASDDTNLYHFTDDTPNLGRGLPVGESLANVDTYVLDKNYRPLPLGVPGEIFVSGIAVGRGYINDPDRTKQSFMTLPKTDIKMYKTGDVGYWSPDRQLMYLGRSDFQVKIRGFRIELEEIESHIIQFKNIQSVAVVVNEVGQSKNLHAYITSDTPIDSNELSSYLSKRLPEYMVPSVIEQLPELPLNNSGKIDRKALSSRIRPVTKNELHTEATKIETDIIAVWKEVFGLENISLNDDYYALGGDSITSFRIYAKIKSIGYSVKLQDILQYSVLHEFAKVVVPSSTTLSPEEPVEGQVSLTPIQARLQRHKSGSTLPQNVWINGHWDTTRLNDAIQYVIQTNGIFMMRMTTQHQAFGSNTLAQTKPVFIREHLEADEAIDQLYDTLSDDAVIAYGFEGNDSFINRIYVSANHLYVDAVSWSIFFTQLESAYSENRRDLHVDHTFGIWAQKLDELTLLPEDTSLWQNTIDRSKDFTKNLAQAFDTESYSEIVQSTVTIPVDKPLAEASVYAATIAALERTLDTSGAGILIESHGRFGDVFNIDLSSTIGWFTNIIPVSGTLKDITDIIDVSEKTKLSYGKAIEEQSINRNHEPRIIVNYLGNVSTSQFTLLYGKHEAPVGNELLEISMAQNQDTIDIAISLFARSKDSNFIPNLIGFIEEELKKTDSSKLIDDDRLASIMKRIGGNSA